MKSKKQTAFQAAMDVARNERLSGFQFRQFRQGAASASPIVILAGSRPPADPLACARLIPLPWAESVYNALAGAPEAAREPGGVGYVCAVPFIARDLMTRFIMAGAAEAEAVR
jgi:hypothetical protein